MANSPSTDNYKLGKGVIYFNRLNDVGVYTGERDLGNAPSFAFNVSIETLEHINSRSGMSSVDLEVISSVSPTVSFTLDEINADNLEFMSLGNKETVTQVAGGVANEEVTCNFDTRVKLANRNLGHWLLPYDGGTVIFPLGATVTGAGGATGIVVGITGDATSGTLTVARTNDTDYVDDEVITGAPTGAAVVNSLTGGTVGTTTPVVLVTNTAADVTYVSGTDYEISTSLKDDKIGRIKFLSGGTVTDGEIVKVSYHYDADSYTKIKAFTETSIEGFLRFVSDNPQGDDQELQIWKVSLSPTAELPFISDDWGTIQMEGKILKDETNHPDSPYMDIIDLS